MTIRIIAILAVLAGMTIAPTAQADTCSGWNGQFINFSNCGGQVCTGFSFGPLFSTNCTEPTYDAPPPAQYPQP